MAADRSLGGVTQGLARCVEAESVKKCGLASKSTASCSHRSTRKKARRPSLENRVMLDLDQACAEVVLHPCWIMVCISYILYVTIARSSKQVDLPQSRRSAIRLNHSQI